jgi:uncharacterized lipoprotein YajG
MIVFKSSPMKGVDFAAGVWTQGNSTAFKTGGVEMIGNPCMMLKACLIMVFTLALAGCADKVPPPTQQVTMATQAIAQAESSGAFEFAPVELKSAWDKLSQAKLAMDKEENDKARRLADEAMIDANLAEAKARSAKSQKVVEEMKESIRVLRQEMDRKVGP